MTDVTYPPTAVPADAEPVRCPYCDRPFSDAERRALHVGEIHDEEMCDEERFAYEEAVESETDELWIYHFKVIVVLLLLYMFTGMLYLIALG